jgi:hypothetical protein
MRPINQLERGRKHAPVLKIAAAELAVDVDDLEPVQSEVRARGVPGKPGHSRESSA